ncbi:MAG: hypothetical protein JXB88_14965 [Spirochaetales bacterium]|nr:hypothetical protein [Spirochaetales bacterium]
MSHKNHIKTEKLKEVQEVCKREIPSWLIALDNIPTLVLFGLGAVILAQWGIIFGITHAVYAVLSILWFWAKICPYCHSFGTRSCPCGYGIISAKLFKKKSGKNFSRIFKKNIPVLFPAWFVPPVIGIYLLISRFSYVTLLYLVLFCFTGFFVIPFVSKIAGCKTCRIKEDCPWMNKKK